MRQHGLRKTGRTDRIREIDEPRETCVSFMLGKGRYAESFLQRLTKLKTIGACDANSAGRHGVE